MSTDNLCVRCREQPATMDSPDNFCHPCWSLWFDGQFDWTRASFPLHEVQWPDTPFELRPHLVLLGRCGSEAHGTYVPPENPDSIDDRDLMGIVMPPPSFYLGLRSWENANAIKGPWDVVLYELRKFIGLLCKQNPNVLGMLWLDPSDYLLISKVGRQVLDRRELFRAREPAFQSFTGYARAQMKKMVSAAAGEREGDFSLSAAERAYAAGIFDGEGHISISETPSPTQRPSHGLTIGVTSTDSGLMDYLMDLFGGSTHPTKQQPDRLPAYRWRANSQLAGEILRCLLPYLRIKYEQARVGIDFAEQITKRGSPLTEETIERRRGLQRQLVNARALPYMGAKRKALVERYGYDCKNASHLVRLLHIGEEYLRTGTMSVRRTWDRDQLVEIKRGGWPLERVREYAEQKFVACQEAYEKSVLPDAIDMDEVDRFVTDVLVRNVQENCFYDAQEK